MMMMRAAGVLAAVWVGCGPATAEPMGQAEAEAFVAPFYAALSQAGRAGGTAALSGMLQPDYRSFSDNSDAGQTPDEVAAGLAGLGQAVPDLAWRVVEVIPAEGRITVRGEATGTPVVPLFGVAPVGKSFNVMSIDIWAVESGRVVSIHHVEDWSGAIRQLSAP